MSGDEKIVDHDGKYNSYSNGMNGPDGYHHDHLFAHYKKDGSISESGLADRSEERERLARGLGRAALNDY